MMKLFELRDLIYNMCADNEIEDAESLEEYAYDIHNAVESGIEEYAYDEDIEDYTPFI